MLLEMDVIGQNYAAAR